MKESFKSANSAKIGKVFETARIEYGLSKNEVSDKAFINVKYINAIESGNYSAFPNEAFAKAYFLKYKKFLSINCDFPRIYEDEINQNPIIQESLPSKKLPSMNILTLAVVLVLTLIIIFTIQNASNQKARKNIFFADSKNISNDLPNKFEDSLFEKSEIQVSKDLNIQKIPKISNSNMLIFNFVDECWIEIYSYEQLILNKLFKYEETFEIEIERPFKIVVGNAAALEASYNGTNIDFIANANRLNVSTVLFNDE
jgi:transcriptional regulator with XRE-family HTH domain